MKIKMSEDYQLSDDALRRKQQAFDVSRRELTVVLEQVILELSATESFLRKMVSMIISISNESVLKEKLPKIIKDLKDKSSSKLEIREVLWKLLDGEIRTTQSEAEKIKNIEPKISEFCETLTELYRWYYVAIVYQGRRVRLMRTERSPRTELEEAEERLKALKAEYLSDTGTEWSDVREEGPIILTRNAVNGDEISPELSDIVKQLKRDEAMRYIKM